MKNVNFWMTFKCPWSNHVTVTWTLEINFLEGNWPVGTGDSVHWWWFENFGKGNWPVSTGDCAGTGDSKILGKVIDLWALVTMQALVIVCASSGNGSKKLIVEKWFVFAKCFGFWGGPEHTFIYYFPLCCEPYIATDSGHSSSLYCEPYIANGSGLSYFLYCWNDNFNFTSVSLHYFVLRP